MGVVGSRSGRSLSWRWNDTCVTSSRHSKSHQGRVFLMVQRRRQNTPPTSNYYYFSTSNYSSSARDYTVYLGAQNSLGGFLLCDERLEHWTLLLTVTVPTPLWPRESGAGDGRGLSVEEPQTPVRTPSPTPPPTAAGVTWVRREAANGCPSPTGKA